MAGTAQRPDWLAQAVATLKTNLQANHLWRRVTKHTIAVTVAFTIVVAPPLRSVYGPSAFLAPMTAVFGCSGRRLGEMVESLVFIMAGAILGTAWSTLGLYLHSLVYAQNQPAAYAIKAMFMLAISLFHGYFRSQSPRIFVFLWIVLITSFSDLLGTQHYVTAATVTQIFYPILTAFGVLLVVGLVVFPEFSGDFLASVTIEALCQTKATLDDAVTWFIEPIKGNRDADGSNPISRRSSSGQRNANEDGEGKKTAESTTTTTTTTTRAGRLKTLTDAKVKLRAQLGKCRKAHAECSFELTYSALPPRNLEPISTSAMGGLVKSVSNVISACESKYAMVECVLCSQPDADDDGGTTSPDDEDSYRAKRKAGKTVSPLERVRLLKPKRSIAPGDAELLDLVMSRIRRSIADLQEQVSSAIDLVIMSLAFCYDVKRLPNGMMVSKGILLAEMDVRVDLFEQAVAAFDSSSAKALGHAASMEEEEAGQLDIMPRPETFLVSSVLLSLRQAAVYTMQMLRYSRKLVEQRSTTNQKKALHLPRRPNWSVWLSSAGERDGMTLPQIARKEARQGTGVQQHERASDSDDEDAGSDQGMIPARTDAEAIPVTTVAKQARPRAPPPSRTAKKTKPNSKAGTVPWFRERAADLLDSVMQSEHLGYALKLSVALFLVSFPSFVGSWNAWYTTSRALWAPLQLVLVFEVAIGSSFKTFAIRAIGVVFGCLWGWLSCLVSFGHWPALVAFMVLGIVPSAYVQLATTFVKAGIISIVSMSVVALATVQQEVSPWQVFLLRMAAFTVGGMVAMLVQTTVFPVRARDRLVESLSTCITYMGRMEASIAVGIEGPQTLKGSSARRAARFNRAKAKAQNALTAAETILPVCKAEPRLKGSFTLLEPIYKEMVYVLQSIMERMDNIMTRRCAYGSIYEELDADLYEHRRNLAASVTLTLFAVNEALVTRLPLPQYLPSCSEAHARLVHRMRELLLEKKARPVSRNHSVVRIDLDPEAVRRATAPKVLTWNANAAGHMESIAYLEELVRLTKLLVGVDAFRSGMLDQMTFQKLMRKLEEKEAQAEKEVAADGHGHEVHVQAQASDSTKKGVKEKAKEPRERAGIKLQTLRRRISDIGPATTRQRPAPRHETSSSSALDNDPEQLPVSLQRVGTRLRMERERGREKSQRG